MHYLRIVPPSPPLSDGVVELLPLTQDDADQIVAIADEPGFIPLMERGLPELQVDLHEKLLLWVGKRASLWNGIETLPTMQDACFAVREVGSKTLAGIVGFNKPHGGAFSDTLNVYYWTSPNCRGRGIAHRALLAGLSWALETYGVPNALIRAANPASMRVAEKAGFTRTGEEIDGAPIFRRRGVAK